MRKVEENPRAQPTKSLNINDYNHQLSHRIGSLVNCLNRLKNHHLNANLMPICERITHRNFILYVSCIAKNHNGHNETE